MRLRFIKRADIRRFLGGPEISVLLSMGERVPTGAMRTVVGVTGASGAPYAYRLLETLEGEIDLILSKDAEEVVRLETGRGPRALAKLATRTLRNEDMGDPPAPGSYFLKALAN